ncbi:hypothetical protein ACH4MU_29980 [Streptomyces albidoflavus]|uniref:Secreted protein n=1 Tax=Streptomyces wadayamensis TaxID=141454 RepID=A0ABR4S5L2_9ACTN|nr:MULTISPECIES: hypothetical protein [Streptomyces]KDR60931.1 hypothetical protein DC60_02795 [Streptomyces wadayamensis]QXQ25872.1 hypothetical protein STALF2_14675 [Streptomyces albidoflavus]QXQ31801.1 hypothetical protein STALF4_14725 [Streptomyces albidoflavus]
MKMIKRFLVAGAALALLAPASASATPSAAAEGVNWRIKCQAKDPKGRLIVVRYGNSKFGWNHFSGKHNIRNCGVINAATRDKADKVEGARLEYWAYALRNNDPNTRVRIVVVVQYARQTNGKPPPILTAPRGETIGVITAYCKNQKNNKCPNWVNE